MPRTSRLFRRLFWTFWGAMLFSFLCGATVLTLAGHSPPHLPDAWMLVPIGSGIVSSLLASVLVAWYLSRPLRHLHWALDRIAAGQFHTRVLPHMGSRDDELVDLGAHFDQMSEQLQRLTESKTQLLHDISHELRSPLSRLRAAIGLSRQDAALSAAMMDRIDREAERLDALIGELLTLHRLEAGTSEPGKDTVDLIELLADIAEDAQFEAQSVGRTLSLQVQGSFITEVDGELIYRAFENVVRNAIKFTQVGSEVEVVAHMGHPADTAGDTLHVTVSDRGPGVDEALLRTMFDPFVRGESDQPGVGFGLGLAIARRAVMAHGGDIRAACRPGGGLTMSISLPRHGAHVATKPTGSPSPSRH